MGAKFFGAAVKRREDPAFVTGAGRFVDDLTLPGLLHAAFVRSVHAHARVRGIKADAASRFPGVVRVLTFSSLSRSLKPLPSLASPPPNLVSRVKLTVREPARHALARSIVRYVGEPIAVVVAGDQYTAIDAAGLVEIDYEPLPAVIDAEAGSDRDAPLLHPDLEDNVAVSLSCGTGDVAAALRSSDIVLRERFIVQRYAGMPLETRGVVATYDRRNGELVAWVSTQLPHFVQQEIAAALELPEHKVRVVTPDVGGGFGTKASSYGEEVVVPLLARELGRPVKWVEERREHIMAAAHSRDQVQDVELAATRQGTISAFRGQFLLDVGAYNSGGFILAYNTLAHLLGPYRIPNVFLEIKGVFTNKCPVAPYRGAGRPEAVFAMDRSIDLLARKIERDPAEVRLRNMVPPESMPYDTGLTYRDGNPLIYDSGDYPDALRKALAASKYREFRSEQVRLRKRGVHRGIGISAYVEGTALGPYESASVRLDRTGHVMVATGACSQGQGHDTSFAQITADALGVPMEWVTIVGGDTAQVPFGIGTFVSRSAVMAGNAIALASQQVREKILTAAAKLLEARFEDIEIEDGRVFVRGARLRSLPVAAVVQAGLPTYTSMGEPPFEATTYYHASNVTYASGVHVAIVEVDIETGNIEIVGYVVAHDCGRVINPLIVAGQIHGGVAQGVGGALFEEIQYDRTGQLVNGSLMEYAVPRARDVPHVDIVHLEHSSPRNPLGVKGAGEGGAISPPAAIANAVEDALAPFGVRIVATPITPARLLNLLAQGRSA